MKKKFEEAKFNRSLKLIAKSSLFIFVGMFLSKLFTYFYRIIIARYYGPEIYGIFSLAIMILLWIFSFSTLGMIEGILRFIPYYRGKNDSNKIKYIFRFSLTVMLISCIISAILLFILSDTIAINIFNEPELSIFLKAFSMLIPIYMIFYTLLAVIRSFERIVAHTFIQDFGENFLKFVLIILFIFMGLETNAIIFSYFLGVVIILFIAYIYCKHKILEIFQDYKLENSSKKTIRKNLIQYSWPLVFFGIIVGILPYIDSFAIGYFSDAYDVGLYNAAVPIASLLFFAPNLFIRLFFPMITREFSKKNYDVISELSKQVGKWILILNLPILLLFLLFPGTFVNLFFGAEFITPEKAVENSLRLLAIGALFYSMTMALNNLLQMKGKSKLILINILFVAIINLILNIILVPIYGIMGAAFSTMIANIILSILLIFQIKHILSIIPYRRKMLTIIISALIPSIILVFIKQFISITFLTMVFQGIFFGLFYILLILLTKSLDKNDLMILKSFKKTIIKKNN